MKSSTMLVIGMVLGLSVAFGLLGFYLALKEEGYIGPKNTVTPEISVSPQSTGEATAYKDLIVLETPREGEKISSPLVIRGKARGTWFFEATFPVVLTDWDGRIIAESYATADGEWMTEEYVPFTAELTFEKPEYGERGSLILQRSNPSGLPENDDAFEITIYFE